MFSYWKQSENKHNFEQTFLLLFLFGGGGGLQILILNFGSFLTTFLTVLLISTEQESSEQGLYESMAVCTKNNTGLIILHLHKLSSSQVQADGG